MAENSLLDSRTKQTATPEKSGEESTGSFLQPPSFSLTADAPVQAKSTSPEHSSAVVQQKTDENPRGDWEKDEDQDGKVIEYEKEEDARSRLNCLQDLGLFEQYHIQTRNEGDKTFYFVTFRGKRTVNNFLEIVRKLEAAYPDASAEDILYKLNSVAGYDNINFQTLIGAKGNADKGIEEKLSEEDLNLLKSMLQHGPDDWQTTNPDTNEEGLMQDASGKGVAMGHVITGMVAGMNYDPQAAANPALQEWTSLGAGELLNNLYATTISGDLGQSASLFKNLEQTPDSYIGNGTDASFAEVRGDLDGFNLGNQIHNDKDLQEGMRDGSRKLSDLLAEYYGSLGEQEGRMRYETFEEGDKQHGGILEQEVKDFSTTYNYKFGKWYGATTSTSSESEAATTDFTNWNDKQQDTVRGERFNNAKIKGENVYLVDDPGRFHETRTGLIPTGTSIKILDQGANAPFNQVSEEYKWRKVCIMDGPLTGKIGWVSNLFIQ